jgi:hypothetical protein
LIFLEGSKGKLMMFGRGLGGEGEWKQKSPHKLKADFMWSTQTYVIQRLKTFRLKIPQQKVFLLPPEQKDFGDFLVPSRENINYITSPSPPS